MLSKKSVLRIDITLKLKTIHGRTRGVLWGGRWVRSTPPPLSKKVPFLKKKSNNIILYISSLRKSHVYTCLNLTYSA